MMLLVLYSIIIPLLIGFFLACFCWRNVLIKQHALLKCCLGLGLGFGICSVLFFIWALMPMHNFLLYILAETGLLILLIMGFVKLARRKMSLIEYKLDSGIKDKPYLALLVLFYALFTSSIISFVFISLRQPHGGWDAVGIWNLHARFLFRDINHWKNLFFVSWSHPDYPLFIPTIIARSWFYAGRDTYIIPALIAILFTFATVGLVFSLLSILRGKNQALLGSIVILTTLNFLGSGASQYADVPLSFFFCASLGLLCFRENLAKSDYFLLVLAGIMAGLSSWVKNEGLLFLIVVIVSRFIVIIFSKGLKKFIREIVPFTMGALPILLAVLYFKIFLAPQNDIFSQDFQVMFKKLMSLPRFFTILSAFSRQLLDFGTYYIAYCSSSSPPNQLTIHFDYLPLGIIVILLSYFFILGPKIDKAHREGVATLFIAIFLMLAGYFCIYLISPVSLEEHLFRSLDRILLQLWPSIILGFFLVVRSP